MEQWIKSQIYWADKNAKLYAKINDTHVNYRAPLIHVFALEEANRLRELQRAMQRNGLEIVPSELRDVQARSDVMLAELQAKQDASK